MGDCAPPSLANLSPHMGEMWLIITLISLEERGEDSVVDLCDLLNSEPGTRDTS